MSLKALSLLVATSFVACAAPVTASEFLTDEPSGQAYNYVSHYRIEINASRSAVWSHLQNFGAWMNAFEMVHESGVAGEVGETLRLYSGQDFMMQTTAAVPNELLTLSNLPITFKGEASTGVAVITLTDVNDKTIVDLTMSRRYEWKGEDENPMKAVRLSAQFQQNTVAMWNGFLGNLKSLSEGR